MRSPRATAKGPRTLVFLFTLGAVVAAFAPLAHAQECPASPPASLKEKRSLAKEWFSRAEAAELAGDDKAAVRAYSCSFAMLPHPSTAYNLARAAERAGDLTIALTAHRDYLTLKPAAPDRADVEARIKVLEEKLAGAAPPAPTPAPVATPEPTPTPEPPVAIPAPAPAPRRRPAPPPEEHPSESRMGTTEWVIAGVGAAAVVAGVVFNVGARSAMNDCRELALANNFSGARDACNRGKTFAYTSYGLFAAAGAAAILDVTFVLGKQSSVERVGLAAQPGGFALSAIGRF